MEIIDKHIVNITSKTYVYIQVGLDAENNKYMRYLTEGLTEFTEWVKL